MKAKILADFQTCISVPLMLQKEDFLMSQQMGS